jgi:hypothetical protein
MHVKFVKNACLQLLQFSGLHMCYNFPTNCNRKTIVNRVHGGDRSLQNGGRY